MFENQNDRVVLVDRDDNELGTAPKLAAHQSGGQLHRAVSVFVVDSEGKLLLQRRAAGKYHSARLWSNTCCTHPGPGEPPAEAAVRRLQEEMGFTCALQPAGQFEYRAELDNGLVEHELDHVFWGSFAGYPRPDPDEVGDWCRLGLDEIQMARQQRPQEFTAWFWAALDCLTASDSWRNAFP